MMRIWIAVRMALVLTLITGIVYPIAMVGLAHLCFPGKANGSLIYRGGRVVGSALIGQNFSSARYFHGRPSAAGTTGYDAANSGGANLGPTNKTLIETVQSRAKVLRETEPGLSHRQIPVGMVTSSASGLDPDISPADAYVQAVRVAAARGLAAERVRRLVDSHIEGRFLGVFGEPRVNVLELNLALDTLGANRAASAAQAGAIARR